MSGASGKVTGNIAGDRIRQPMSIEQLLVWAYADQMVDRAQRDLDVKRPSPPRQATSQLWSEGAPVNASAANGFGASDDAWEIHELVRALQPLTLDLGPDLRASRYHGLSQYRGFEPPTDRAATADHTALPWPTDGILKIDVRMLVMVHASRATRPEYPGRPDFRLKAVHKGLVRHPKSKGGVYGRGWYHHVELDGVSPGEAAETAAKYRAWWEALDWVRRQFPPDGLTMFRVTPEMPRKFQAGLD